jgi:hypothetical protein
LLLAFANNHRHPESSRGIPMKLTESFRGRIPRLAIGMARGWATVAQKIDTISPTVTSSFTRAASQFAVRMQP